jgi:N-formylglutamate amidohydrolase
MPADQSYAAQTELTRLLEELSARSLADQARATERYRALLEQLAAGGIDVVTLRAEYERLVSEQSARLAHDLTTLGVNYYRAVLDLNRASVERLFDELLSVRGSST